MSRRWWHPLDRGARRVLLAGVHGYQRWLGWLMGGHCRFVPSCSFYAEEALVRGPLLPAVWLIVWRLLRCQPLCRPGMDPVPEWMGGEGLSLVPPPTDGAPPRPQCPSCGGESHSRDAQGR